MLLCFLSRLLAGLDSDLHEQDEDSRGVTWLFEDGSSPPFSTLPGFTVSVFRAKSVEVIKPILEESDTAVTGRGALVRDHIS